MKENHITNYNTFGRNVTYNHSGDEQSALLGSINIAKAKGGNDTNRCMSQMGRSINKLYFVLSEFSSQKKAVLDFPLLWWNYTLYSEWYRKKTSNDTITNVFVCR